LGRVTSVLFLAGIVTFVTCGSPCYAAVPGEPLTIIRATLGDNGDWDVHQFVLLPGTGPPESITPIEGAEGLKCSVIDYPMFRARYVMKFEAGLREGLAEEFIARDGIKRASYITTYLFCSPLWPMHILWELPLAGAEKERMLDMGGITIVIPSVETGGVGEIPGRIDDGGILHFDESLLDDQAQSEMAWQGAGLYLSYRVEGELSVADLYPGWPEGTRGTVLLLLEAPYNSGYEINAFDDTEILIASLWPGRYEWALGRAIHVFSDGNSFFGYSRTKTDAKDGIVVRTFPASHFREYEKSAGIKILRNRWPRLGGIIREKPWVMALTGLVLSLAVFHIINFSLLKIKYTGSLAGALYDPVASHVCILVLATIFAPFLGLGWIAGAYAAGRYLKWRHPDVRWAWPAMLIYVLLTACAFEAIFIKPLWV